MVAEAVIKQGKVLPFIFKHPWVFKGALHEIKGDYENGDVIRVVGPKGDFIAWGWVNTSSKLSVRLICFEEKFEEVEWLKNRISQAIFLRKNILSVSKKNNSYRLIHSEGDGIPGLIVDQYGSHLILQISCFALERLQPILVEELSKIEGIKGIVRKDDATMARLEGMASTNQILWGSDLPSEFLLKENGIEYELHFQKAQKTGFYLDQRNNRQLLLQYCQKGKRALDAFCYTGGFSLNLSKHLNFDEIISIDSSEESLKQLQKNAKHNGCSNITTIHGNVFHLLEGFVQEKQFFDLIILDPPKFIPNKRSFDKGFSGYKKLNRRAFRLLKPGGFLFTCSCSQMMNEKSFTRMLAESAGEAGKEAIILERTYQPPDHPVSIACPEGSYFNGFLLQIR